MDDVAARLEAGAEPVYDRVRRPCAGAQLNGSYTEIFTGSLLHCHDA